MATACIQPDASLVSHNLCAGVCLCNNALLEHYHGSVFCFSHLPQIVENLTPQEVFEKLQASIGKINTAAEAENRGATTLGSLLGR
jgi:hypothetical protein